MSMKPKPARHDRRSYSNTHGGPWRENDNAEQTKQMPPNGGCAPYHNETRPNLNSGVRKTAKPKVFTSTDIERSILKALTSRKKARERRIVGSLKPFRWNPAGNQSRPVEPDQQPEASLAWWVGDHPCEA